MNLYKITATHDSAGHLCAWEGTQLDAKATAKAMENAATTKPVITPTEVPTDKPGLLAWLNANFTSDNE